MNIDNFFDLTTDTSNNNCDNDTVNNIINNNNNDDDDLLNTNSHINDIFSLDNNHTSHKQQQQESQHYITSNKKIKIGNNNAATQHNLQHSIKLIKNLNNTTDNSDNNQYILQSKKSTQLENVLLNDSIQHNIKHLHSTNLSNQFFPSQSTIGYSVNGVGAGKKLVFDNNSINELNRLQYNYKLQSHKIQDVNPYIPLSFQSDMTHGANVSDHGVYKHHWTGYYEQRTKQLNKQLSSHSIYNSAVISNNSNYNDSNSSNNNKDSVKRIFANLTFYVNGRAESCYMYDNNNNIIKEYSQYDLVNLIKLYGGKVLIQPSRKQLTHYVTTNLSNNKLIKELNKRNNNNSYIAQSIYFVKPQYIIDCINAGKRLNEMKYNVLNEYNNTTQPL